MEVTWLNLLALASMGIAMKAIALLVPGSSAARIARFIFSPVLAPNSLERSQPFSAAPRFLLRAGVCLGALLLYYWIYWKLVNAFHLHGIALSYLAAPAVLLITEVFVVIVTILWLPSGRLLARMISPQERSANVVQIPYTNSCIAVSFCWKQTHLYEPVHISPGPIGHCRTRGANRFACRVAHA